MNNFHGYENCQIYLESNDRYAKFDQSGNFITILSSNGDYFLNFDSLIMD